MGCEFYYDTDSDRDFSFEIELDSGSGFGFAFDFDWQSFLDDSDERFEYPVQRIVRMVNRICSIRLSGSNFFDSRKFEDSGGWRLVCSLIHLVPDD